MLFVFIFWNAWFSFGVISLFVIKSVYLLLTDDPYNAESIMGNWEAAVDPEIDIGNVGNVPEFLKGGPVPIVVPDDVRNVMDDDCPNPFTTEKLWSNETEQNMSWTSSGKKGSKKDFNDCLSSLENPLFGPTFLVHKFWVFLIFASP